jgi:dTMP kinase
MEILKHLAAQFVSFEGVDGCGKSTLLEDLARWLQEKSIPYVKTREPGGTRLGEKVREVLLDPSFESMNTRAEVLLYSASRAQLVEEIILPALRQGKWVLADRYVDATLAYQGFGRGLGLEPLGQIQHWATGGLWPNLTILLDCDLDLAARRRKARNGKEDRIELENRDFHQRVKEGYLQLARTAPERFLVLDGSQALPDVLTDFRENLLKALTRSRDSSPSFA